jgi:hypothetical protein
MYGFYDFAPTEVFRILPTSGRGARAGKLRKKPQRGLSQGGPGAGEGGRKAEGSERVEFSIFRVNLRF